MSVTNTHTNGTASRKLASVSETPWTRPLDWLVLPSITTSDEKFVGLHAIYEDSNFLALSASGNYTVDWGDGSPTENIAAGVVAQHEYTFSTYDVGNTTLTSRGYKQAIVSVVPQAGQQLTALNLHHRHSSLAVSYASGFIDIAVAGQYITDLRISYQTPNGTNVINFADLERVNILKTDLKQCDHLLFSCASLRSISNLSTSESTASIIPVTFQDAGDTVTAALHGVRAGDSVIFTSIISTTGIVAYNRYFAISVTANTFQVSTSYNGTASVLSTNGTGMLAIGTDFSSMFNSCASLQSIPLINTAAGTTFINMFSVCRKLQTIPLLNTAIGTNFSGMFNSCASLQSIPLINTSAGTNFSSMFTGCASLQSIPLLNTALGTNFSGMFNSCALLQSIPLLNTALGTNFSNMFTGCASLQSIPLLNTAIGTDFSSMFSACASLQTIPALNTASGTNFSNMFNSCASLQTIPLLNTALGIDFSIMFASCVSLQTIPALNTASGTNFSNMFSSCRSLQTVPLLNTSAGTNFSSMFSACPQLSKVGLTGIKSTLSVSSCKLSQDRLQDIINGLTTVSGLTLTISSNYGAVTPVSLSGTASAGSTTISMASTTGIVVGMQVTGTGMPSTTAIAVTFQDVGDTVTLNSHGLSNGDEVSFSSIVTTTGIVSNTIYFVISSTTNTFQLSATIAGAAMPLTTNGTGSLRYKATVVTINVNSSVVISRPATASGTNTLSFRNLKTNTALLKGWSVTG